MLGFWLSIFLLWRLCLSLTSVDEMPTVKAACALLSTLCVLSSELSEARALDKVTVVTQGEELWKVFVSAPP